MEELFSTGEIDLNDIEQVYSGLFLSLFTEFEILLEQLFLGLLDGSLTSLYRPVRKMKVSPSAECRTIVYSGKSYLDWLPYQDHTLKRAKRFFINGEPFCRLDGTQKGSLKDYHTIRNAIAHKSDAAKNRFDSLLSGLTLLPNEKKPPGYLRSKPSGGQTQFEIIVIELRTAVRILCG